MQDGIARGEQMGWNGEGVNIKSSVLCAGFKFHQGSGAGGIGYESEQSPTLTADWHNPAVFCMADDNAKAAIDADMCGTLKVGGAAPIVSSTVLP